MLDGYSGYNKLKKIRRCCCYAHIRRYLIEAIPNGHDKDYSHPAVQGVLYCNKLFEYERSYKAKGLSYTQVHKRRLKDEKPVVEGFIRWLDAQRPEKGSRMDRAVTYIRNRKDTLMTYLEDGRVQPEQQSVGELDQTGNPGPKKLVVQRQSGGSQCEHGSLYHGRNGKGSWTPSIQLLKVPAGQSPKYRYKRCRTRESCSMERKSEDSM